jgi:hypothetical protein
MSAEEHASMQALVGSIKRYRGRIARIKEHLAAIKRCPCVKWCWHCQAHLKAIVEGDDAKQHWEGRPE